MSLGWIWLDGRLMTLISALISWLMLCIFGSWAARAAGQLDSDGGRNTGSIPAQQLVSAITNVRAPEVEVRPAETKSVEEKSLEAIPLPSALELTAGTDRLIGLSEVTHQLSFFAEARYRLSQRIQLGLSAALRAQGGDRAQELALQPLIGPTFNFGGGADLGNSFYFSPKAGLTASRKTIDDQQVESATQPTVSATLGKRFAISDSVALTPSVGVIKRAASDPAYSIQPIGLSVFF